MNSGCLVFSDAKAAAEQCAAAILEWLAQRLSQSTTATLAVSGGSTPRLLFDAMAAAKFDWSGVHIFQADERAVPPDDERSNFRLAAEHLLRPAGIPEANIHRVPAELPAQEAAARYAEDIRRFFHLSAGELPVFDVIHQGIGPDAHTASLFPGEPLIHNRHEIAAAVFVRKMNAWRITLLPGVLQRARNTVMLAAGDDKAGALRHILKGPFDPLQYPAQIVTEGERPVQWFLDAAAARLLTEV